MTQKPRTFLSDLAHLPKALQYTTKLKRWVVWRWELRRNTKGVEVWSKPPYQCAYPSAPAKSNDPSTWDTYEAALAAVADGKADGIGLMLKDSEVAAADLDHVRNAETGELLDWAERLYVEAKNLGIYVEVTVSGCGLRFIGKAENGGELHRKFTFNRTTSEGIELYRKCARYITISGLQQGECEELAPIDSYLDTLLARFDASNFDFNTAGPQLSVYYQELIEHGPGPGAERSDRFQEVVWHLAATGWTVDEIHDELAKYPTGIAQKYAGRLLREVERSFWKWQNERRAAAIGSAPAVMVSPAGSASASAPGAIPPAATAPWPQIRVIPSELPRVVNEAEAALLAYGHELYQRGGILVRPVLMKFRVSERREDEGWQLLPVTQSYMIDTLCCAAQFIKYNGRTKSWLPVDAPDKVANIYLSRVGRWQLPKLSGIIHTPFLRKDGSICEIPGYDVESGLLFKDEGQVFPPIPHFPTKSDAFEALIELENLISTFPFVTKADASVALSALRSLGRLKCLARISRHSQRVRRTSLA